MQITASKMVAETAFFSIVALRRNSSGSSWSSDVPILKKGKHVNPSSMSKAEIPNPLVNAVLGNLRRIQGSYQIPLHGLDP